VTVADPKVSFSVLVVDNNPDILALFKRLLEDRGYRVQLATSGEAAVAALAITHFDLIFTDLNMGRVDGMAVLARADQCEPPPLVIVMTGYASLETVLGAMRGGAHDYVTKPFTLTELGVIVDKATSHLRLKDVNEHLVAELADAYRLIAELSNRCASMPTADLPSGDSSQPAPQPTLPTTPQPPAPAVLSAEVIAAYRAVAWQPDRAEGRLLKLYRQGVISRESYDRLRGLMPKSLPVL